MRLIVQNDRVGFEVSNVPVMAEPPVFSGKEMILKSTSGQHTWTFSKDSSGWLDWYYQGTYPSGQTKLKKQPPR